MIYADDQHPQMKLSENDIIKLLGYYTQYTPRISKGCFPSHTDTHYHFFDNDSCLHITITKHGYMDIELYMLEGDMDSVYGACLITSGLFDSYIVY